MKSKGVEIVVVTTNSARHIGPCVESIMAAGAVPIIADNGSSDGTLEVARSRCPGVKVVALGENVGYGQAMNQGFKETAGDIVILSNPDVVYLPDSIPRMVEFLRKDPRIGITGPQQMFPDRSWQRSYGDLPGIWSGLKDAVGITTLHSQLRRAVWPRRIDRNPKEVPYLDGAVLAVRREAFLGTKGFSRDFFIYSEECDLCLRIKKGGWLVVFFPNAQVVHIRGADSAKTEASEQFLRYLVTSQHLLASKYLPNWKVRVYGRLQVAHYRRLWLLHRLVRFVDGANPVRDGKIRMFDALARFWGACYRLGAGTRVESAH